MRSTLLLLQAALAALLLSSLAAGCATRTTDAVAGPLSLALASAVADGGALPGAPRPRWLHRLAWQPAEVGAGDPCRFAPEPPGPALAALQAVAAGHALLLEPSPQAVGTSGQPALQGMDARVLPSVADATRSRSDGQPPLPACRVALRVLDGLTGSLMWTGEATGEAVDRALALAQAWDEALRRLRQRLDAHPPQAAVLAIDGNRIRLSGGTDQGLAVGQSFAVHAQGDRVRSRATGGVVILPGRLLARVRIERVWPRSVPVDAGAATSGPAAGQGALGRIVEGSLDGQRPEELTVPLAAE